MKIGGKFLIAAAVLLAVSAGHAKDPAVVSVWAAAPPQIDGQATDWQGDAVADYKKLGVEYGFRNDAAYCYILFKFKDPEYLSSIRMTGMTVFVSMPDKKQKDYQIRFHQKQVTADEYIVQLEGKRGPLSDEDKQKIKANQFYLNYSADVSSKAAGEDAVAPADAPPAAFRSGQVADGLVYEFAIPLNRIGDAAPGLGVEPGSNVKLGFEWGGMTKEMKEQRMRQVVSGSSRADSSGGGSFDPRDENEGGARDSASIASMRRRSPKKYSFWVDVRLADGE